ncbi:NLR family CARD domain-containing protein 3-like isoform X2 [Brienomyrus brachyistius]|nr:NLR family CARD domain-containing protein 3-like isoform X2 [Brienomyrus brachyistius]
MDPSLCSEPKKPRTDYSFAVVQEKHKSNLKRKFENVSEGISRAGKSIHLNSVFTNLDIIEGDMEKVLDEHEICQIEIAPRKETSTIPIHDILKPLEGEMKTIRTVLTKGIAGIGKTFSVNKFILDWANGKKNQDIDFVFQFSFRELNLMKQKFSLMKLVYQFYPEIKELHGLENYKILFILDGFDECRFPLKFKNNECQSSLKTKLPLDELLTNLIWGNMFRSACLWITSRPAAASQIPPECVDRISVIQGFNDFQKEEYFRNRFSDGNLITKIISHVKSSRSIYIMCHIPLCCWIAATVLKEFFTRKDREIPTTLTQMYTHFLLIQINRNEKYFEENDEGTRRTAVDHQKIIQNLGKLAFQELYKKNALFSEEDLKDCGIDVRDVLYSGICTEIIKEECFQIYKVYCFVHLSIQEYLAALHVFYLFVNKTMKPLDDFFKMKPRVLHGLHKAAVDKALSCQSGHLDLFLRFLLGISLDSNQRLLENLLPLRKNSSHSIMRTTQYIIKILNGRKISADRGINLVHCLMELNYSSLVEKVQKLESPGSARKLSLTECSALAYVLLLPHNVCDELDLKKFNVPDAGLCRLAPVIRSRKTAVFNHCKLSLESCKVLASVLESARSHLVDLHLSHCDLGDQALGILCSGLKSRQCQLERLDLSFNKLSSAGVNQLCDVLRGPQCKLQYLDLSSNDLRDAAVKVLCEALPSPQWKLQTMKLSSCRITEQGFASLASALCSNPPHLKELDLSNNNPGRSGAELLSAAGNNLTCKVTLGRGDERRSDFLKYACKVILDPNTVNKFLYISDAGTKVTRRGRQQPYPHHPGRFSGCNQVLCRAGLHGCCYWEAELDGCEAYVGMAYEGIVRSAACHAARLGYSDKSWALYCSAGKVSACHNKEIIDISVPQSSTCRIGVYLDWTGGSLSFYSVSSDTLTHLYTFHSTFTEVLYPGFRLLKKNTSWTLCRLH